MHYLISTSQHFVATSCYYNNSLHASIVGTLTVLCYTTVVLVVGSAIIVNQVCCLITHTSVVVQDSTTWDSIGQLGANTIYPIRPVSLMLLCYPCMQLDIDVFIRSQTTPGHICLECYTNCVLFNFYTEMTI